MRLACRLCSRPCLSLVTVTCTILIFPCQNTHSIITPVPGGYLSRRMSIKSMLLPASGFAPDERLRSNLKAILGRPSTSKPLHGLHLMRGNIRLGVVVCKRSDDSGLARGTFGATTMQTSLRNLVLPLTLRAPAAFLEWRNVQRAGVLGEQCRLGRR